MSSPLQDTEQPNIQLQDDLWKQYRTLILSGLAVIIFALLAGFFIYQNYSKTNAEATELYLKTPTPETWKLIVEKYPKSLKAADSLLNLASDALAKKQYDQALSYYQKFNSSFSSHPAKPGSDLAIATCLEALGKKAEAISAYQKISKDSTHPYSGVATLGLARLYEVDGKITEAKSLLTDYLSKYPMSSSAKDAHITLNRLNSVKPAEPKK